MISVLRIGSGCLVLALAPWASSGQAPDPDYGRCSDPDYRLCYTGGKGVNVGDLANAPWTKMRPATSSAGARKTPPAASGPVTNRVSPMDLQDWRFSHPAPALLVSVNIGSLLQSPLWAPLISALSAGSGDLNIAAIEKARSALGGIGQLLVSLSLNGAGSPSVLVLAKGNMDSPAGSWLRSSPGTQIRRIDAITTLAGDANSLAMANLRMQSKTPRTSFNPLQQTATLEALKYDAWIGLDPAQMAFLASSFGGGSNPALGMIGNLRGISIGLYLREQLRIEAVLETPSTEMAARMLAAYQGQAKAQAGEDQTWAVAEGANLRFTEIVDASHLKEAAALDPAVTQMLGPKIAALVQGLAGSNPQSAGVATPKTPPGTIVIQGLAAGPRTP